VLPLDACPAGNHNIRPISFTESRQSTGHVQPTISLKDATGAVNLMVGCTCPVLVNGLDQGQHVPETETQRRMLAMAPLFGSFAWHFGGAGYQAH